MMRALTCGLLLLGTLAGCGERTERDVGSNPPLPSVPNSGPDFSPAGPIPDGELGDFFVEFDCSVGGEPAGTLVFELWPDAAPRSLRLFLRLVQGGGYDGTTIDRVEREFILRGGGDDADPAPFGEGSAEPSLAPEHEHHYGVLSMVSPPTRKFTVCLAESPQVWALDHQGVSVLGKLVRGVVCLETLANVETTHRGDNDRSLPLVPVLIDAARVLRGPVGEAEVVLRPRPDLKGEPERIAVRHLRISFRGLGPGRERGVTRSRVEAAALAQEILGLLRSGSMSFEDAARRWSDDPLLPGSEVPALRRVSNFGVVDVPAQRARQDAPRMLNSYIAELGRRLSEGSISRAELLELQQEKAVEIAEWVQDTALDRREDVNSPAYTQAAFSLEVGEVGVVPFDRFNCPGGWYLLQRVE